MSIDTTAIRGTAGCTLHTSPLGIRFWDSVLQTVISDGLQVTAYPEGNPGRQIEAISNGSGIFVFHNLPGLQEFEYRQGQKSTEDSDVQKPWKDMDPWKDEVAAKPFNIEVREKTGKFIPFLLKLFAPHRGIVTWNITEQASPPGAEAAFIPLFSAPARKTPPGMAVLRADLWDRREKRPAAHGLIEAWFDGVTVGSGVADEKGRIAVVFPYPEPARLQISSSPASPPRNAGIIPLRRQEWRIELRARYRPDLNAAPLPDLKLVCGQPPATLWEDRDLQHEMREAVLRFGQESILRTRNGNEKELPVLYITSAGSPP